MQQPRETKILPHHQSIVHSMGYRHFKFLWSQPINTSSLMAWAAVVVWQKFANILEEHNPPASGQKNDSSTLKTKAVCSSKTSVNLYLATWHNIQENNNLHNQPHDNLKS
jgi:hypothetical protein